MTFNKSQYRPWLAATMIIAGGLCTASGGTQALAAQIEVALPSQNAGRGEILRKKIDRAHGKAWELGIDSVNVYSGADRRRLRSITLPGWNVADFMCPPDIAIDRSGNAWVSSNVMTTLWRIDGNDYTVSRLKLALRGFENRDSGFSGLVFVPDGTLFAVTALPASLWRIDLKSARAAEIALPQRLRSACVLSIPSQAPPAAAVPHLSLCVEGKRAPLRIDVMTDQARGNITNAPCDLEKDGG